MLTVSPAGAAQAYASVASGEAGTEAGQGFGAMLGQALQGVVQAGHAADTQAMTAIAGGGNVTEVVTAVSRAELSLQAAVSIRDKMVQAYQDVMRMPL